MVRVPGIASVGESRGSLLQLARKSKDGGKQRLQEADEDSVAASQDVVIQQNVIAQVTSRDQVSPATGPADPEDSSESRSSWRLKFRSLFCCLAPPAADAYYRSSESEAVVVRPPIPPTPPRYTAEPVLGPLRDADRGKKCLVLDLDETLVHSSFKPIPNPDYIIPVEIEGKVVDVYVLKRPWMDHFMNSVGSKFEVVVFTASLSKYADPLLDMLDKAGVVRWRLFRESCCPYEGNYVKDLCCLGRDLAHTIIVDNSPHSYVFQPDNALPIGTFIDDMDDQELLDILPVLLAVEKVDDVRQHLGLHIANLHSTQRKKQLPMRAPT